jgi:hypothetical protein
VSQLDDERGQLALFRSPQSGRTRPVRTDRDDLRGVIGTSRIKQSLQQRADAGYQDNDPGRDRQAKLVHGVLTLAGEIAERHQTSQSR